MMPATIKINGLSELRGALKAAEGATPKALRPALNEAAEELLDYARPLVPRRSGRAAGSMKVRSTQKAARVVAGGPKAPYYPWLDFGGTVGRGRKPAVAVGRGNRRSSDQQARAGSVRRRFYAEGRYIYPTLRKHHEEIIARIGESVLRVIREAGLEVDP